MPPALALVQAADSAFATSCEHISRFVETLDFMPRTAREHCSLVIKQKGDFCYVYQFKES
jgi:hypothetical protein